MFQSAYVLRINYAALNLYWPPISCVWVSYWHLVLINETATSAGQGKIKEHWATAS